MIQIQAGPKEDFTTILTSIFIPCKNILTAKSDVLFGKSIISHEDDHPRNFYGSIDEPDGLIILCGCKGTPAFKIEKLVLLIYRFGRTRVKHAKGPFERSQVNRKKGPI
jgi:hypothetical protein